MDNPNPAESGFIPQGRAYSDAGVDSPAASERLVLSKPLSFIIFVMFILTYCWYCACMLSVWFSNKKVLSPKNLAQNIRGKEEKSYSKRQDDLKLVSSSRKYSPRRERLEIPSTEKLIENNSVKIRELSFTHL